MKHWADQKAAADNDRISTDWQISYWAMKLGTSEELIEDAIDAVGDNIADVRQYFFCGPPRPVVVRPPAAAKARRREKVHQPVFDWLCAPSVGLQSMRIAE